MNNIWTKKRKIGFTVGDWIYWDDTKLGPATYKHLSNEDPVAMKVLDMSPQPNWITEGDLIWVATAEAPSGQNKFVNCNCVKKVTQGYKP
jgi:hypothetical protein